MGNDRRGRRREIDRRDRAKRRVILYVLFTELKGVAPASSREERAKNKKRDARKRVAFFVGLY